MLTSAGVVSMTEGQVTTLLKDLPSGLVNGLLDTVDGLTGGAIGGLPKRLKLA
jgi:hypothetical protein